MELDIINKMSEFAKESGFVQKFLEELSDELKRKSGREVNNTLSSDILKQEGTLYQVVEMTTDGAYLQNTKTGKVAEEKDISKELYNLIGNDSIIKFENGEYIDEPDITDEFMNSLVDIDELDKIQNDFFAKSGIDKNPADARYTLVSKDSKSSEVEYDGNLIKVPNELIPFFAESGTELIYKDKHFQINY